MYSTNCSRSSFIYYHDVTITKFESGRKFQSILHWTTRFSGNMHLHETHFKKGDGTIISIHNTGVHPVWAKYYPCNKLWRQSMTIISLRNSEGVFMDHLLVIIILIFISDAWKCKLMHHTKFCEGKSQKKKKIVLRLDLMIVKDWTVCQSNSFYRF